MRKNTLSVFISVNFMWKVQIQDLSFSCCTSCLCLCPAQVGSYFQSHCGLHSALLLPMNTYSHKVACPLIWLLNPDLPYLGVKALGKLPRLAATASQVEWKAVIGFCWEKIKKKKNPLLSSMSKNGKDLIDHSRCTERLFATCKENSLRWKQFLTIQGIDCW